MEKITEKLKTKYKNDIKGKVYLYIIKANELAFANSYKGISIDKDVRVINEYIQNRLDSIFMTEGLGYWHKEYKGFDRLLDLAKLAQSDINGGIYSIAVIILIEAALASYMPKGEKRVEEVKPQFTPLVQTVVSEGVTGAKLVKQKEQEERELEEEEEQEAFDTEALEDGMDLL